MKSLTLVIEKIEFVIAAEICLFFFSPITLYFCNLNTHESVGVFQTYTIVHCKTHLIQTCLAGWGVEQRRWFSMCYFFSLVSHYLNNFVNFLFHFTSELFPFYKMKHFIVMNLSDTTETYCYHLKTQLI